MLRIAICDDVELDRNKIYDFLIEIEAKYNQNFEKNTFSSGEALCQSLEKTSYDIILLDILMYGMDGIETAKKIRSMGVNSILIFISSYNERWREMFSLQTTAFIDKPCQSEQLETIIENIVSQSKKIDTFSFKLRNEVMSVALVDIIYVESNRNKITLTTTTGSYTFYSTISKIWNELKEYPQFIKPRSSHLFNLEYIDIRSGNIIMKSCGTTINIGRNFKEETLFRYFEYSKNRRAL